MKVSFTKAITLFQELGFANAARWPADKIMKHISTLPTDIPNMGDGPSTTESKGLLTSILATLDTEEGIELEKDVVEANGKAKKKKPAKEKKAPKASANGKEKKTKPAKPAKEKAGMDKFGSRIGSKRAALNSAFAKTPKTMAVLAKEGGIDPHTTYYIHLRALTEKGLIKRVEDGYRLP